MIIIISIIIVCIVLLLIIGIFSYDLFEKIYVRNVLKTSDLLASLIKINNKYNFNKISGEMKFIDELSSKKKFDKYDFDMNFSHYVYTNSHQILDQAYNCMKNIILFEKYNAEVETLLQNKRLEHNQQENSKLYKKIENKLFEKNKLKPQIDLNVILFCSYTSPAGRNYYEKKKNYNLLNVKKLMPSKFATLDKELNATKENKICQSKSKIVYDINNLLDNARWPFSITFIDYKNKFSIKQFCNAFYKKYNFDQIKTIIRKKSYENFLKNNNCDNEDVLLEASYNLFKYVITKDKILAFGECFAAAKYLYLNKDYLDMFTDNEKVNDDMISLSVKLTAANKSLSTNKKISIDLSLNEYGKMVRNKIDFLKEVLKNCASNNDIIFSPTFDTKLYEGLIISGGPNILIDNCFYIVISEEAIQFESAILEGLISLIFASKDKNYFGVNKVAYIDLRKNDLYTLDYDRINEQFLNEIKADIYFNDNNKINLNRFKTSE